jgi:predicted Ser/Thr protein kinase
MELVNLINLLIDTRKDKLPNTYDSFKEKYLNDNGTFRSVKEKQDVAFKLMPYISYLNRENDPRQFAVPEFTNISVEMPEMVTEKTIDDLIEEENGEMIYRVNHIDEVVKEKNKVIENIQTDIEKRKNDINKLKKSVEKIDDKIRGVNKIIKNTKNNKDNRVKRKALKDVKNDYNKQKREYASKLNNVKKNIKDKKDELRVNKRQIKENEKELRGILRTLKKKRKNLLEEKTKFNIGYILEKKCGVKNLTRKNKLKSINKQKTPKRNVNMSIEQIHQMREKTVADLFRRVKKEIPGVTIRFVDDHENIPNHADWIIVSFEHNNINSLKFDRIGYETEFFKYGIELTGSDIGSREDGKIIRELFYGKNDEIWKDFDKERNELYKQKTSKTPKQKTPKQKTPKQKTPKSSSPSSTSSIKKTRKVQRTRTSNQKTHKTRRTYGTTKSRTQNTSKLSKRDRRDNCVLPEEYIYVGRLGETGKDGETWKVRNTKNGKEYACKIFTKTKSKKSIQQEIEAQHRLSGKNVAPDVIWKGELCFIMELIKGKSFKEMKLKKVTKKDVDQWVHISKTLADNDIAYNDNNLKLNLIYSEDKNRWILIDYGMLLPESKIPRNAKKGKERRKFLYSYNLRLFLRNAENMIVKNKHMNDGLYRYTPIGGGFIPKKSYPTLLHEIESIGELDKVFEFQNNKRMRLLSEKAGGYDKKKMIGV